MDKRQGKTGPILPLSFLLVINAILVLGLDVKMYMTQTEITEWTSFVSLAALLALVLSVRDFLTRRFFLKAMMNRLVAIQKWVDHIDYQW